MKNINDLAGKGFRYFPLLLDKDYYPEFTEWYGKLEPNLKMDPKSYQNDSSLNWDFHANWYWVNSFDKFKFVNDWDIKKETETINSKTLLITSPDNYNKDNNNLIKTVYFVDKKPAFDILSIYDQKY